MTAQSKSFRKKLARGASCAALVGMLVAVNPEPARADFATDAILTATKALDVAWQAMQKLQVGMAAAAASAGQYMQSKIATMNAENINNNTRQTAEASQAMAISTAALRPSSQSNCHIAHSSRSASADHAGGGAVAQAMAQGNANRPKDAATNAQEIKNECTLGFVPTQGDPEFSAYSALGLGTCSGSATHARADRTLESLIGPLEYMVPTDMPKPTNGVYKPYKPTGTLAAQYYPFIAALTYCQHITPTLPHPPQGSSSATVDLVAIGPYVSSESQTSVAPGTCYRDLARRMQVGSGVTAFQDIHAAQDPCSKCLERRSSAIQMRHKAR